MAKGLPWIEWDVGYYSNPKARAAGKNGRALHHAASLWSADNLTDGVILPTDLPLICAQAEVPKSTVTICVRVGLFDPLPEGWFIHDFFPRNKTRAEVEGQRQKWADKKARQRGVSPGDSPRESHENLAVRQTDRQTVTNEYISDNDDYSDTGQSSSSSSFSEASRQTARETFASATARTLAGQRTDITNHRAWIKRTTEGLLAERLVDLDRCIDNRLSMVAAIELLTTIPAEPTKPTRAAWYHDPQCECGDGWVTNDLGRLEPCHCQRQEPYIATVTHIHGELA